MSDVQQIKILSPGRICLFGDHQDYLGLPVIACAINRYIELTAKENNENVFRLYMVDIHQERVIAIGDAFENLKHRDYYASALRVLKKRGCIPNKGYDVHITGNIPINSGTSSSSAVLLAWIKFLIIAFGINEVVTPELLSYMGYQAEIVEHNEPGGMMDHYTIGVGNIVHIGTKKPFTCKVIGDDLVGLITGVSGIKKDTVGLIGNLKKHTFRALEKITAQCPKFDLCKAKITDIETYIDILEEVEKPYFKAAIINHHYTQLALKAFKKRVVDWKEIGQYMNDHHDVLKNLLKITVPKIDSMIEAALNAGAYGAKIVGSGGGGSIAVIAPKERQNMINEAIIKAGAVESYVVKVSDGVKQII